MLPILCSYSLAITPSSSAFVNMWKLSLGVTVAIYKSQNCIQKFLLFTQTEDLLLSKAVSYIKFTSHIQATKETSVILCLEGLQSSTMNTRGALIHHEYISWIDEKPIHQWKLDK